VRVFDATYSVGAAISQARKAQRLTQAELAELSGVSQADISRIERSLLSPTTPTYLRLVAGLGGQLTLVLPAPGEKLPATAPHVSVQTREPATA
jgi:transcriptional regulator with XRE-family HTH domain